MELLFSILVGIGAIAFFLFVSYPLIFFISKTWYVTIPLVCALMGGWEGFFFGIGVNILMIFILSYFETTLDISDYLDSLKIKQQLLREAKTNASLLPRISKRNRLLKSFHLFSVTSTYTMIIVILIASFIFKNQFPEELGILYYSLFFISLGFMIILPRFFLDHEFRKFDLALSRQVLQRKALVRKRRRFHDY